MNIKFSKQVIPFIRLNPKVDDLIIYGRDSIIIKHSFCWRDYQQHLKFGIFAIKRARVHETSTSFAGVSSISKPSRPVIDISLFFCF